MKKVGAIAQLVTVLLIVVLLVVIYGVFQKFASGGTVVVLETNKGEILIELYSDMPITAGNFQKLVEEGFYDGILFHRVLDGFMIQSGDPLSRDSSKKEFWGTGGPGYMIKDEFSETYSHSNKRGTISMANGGPDTGGSQFFINLQDNVLLDDKHPVFGEVIGGMDVVDAIAKVEVEINQFDEMSRPIEEIKIISARVR